MHYIGFDLGDGESSLSHFDDAWGASAMPQSIYITSRESFPTAVAVTVNTGETVIGSKVTEQDPNLTDIRVCFKRDFKSGKGDVNESFRRFICGVLSELRKADLNFDIDDEKQCRFVVGQPADWDDATVKRYRQLLEICGIHDPLLVSESRAALVYLSTAKFLQASTVEETSTLVCDFGSSTLDFAYSPDGKEDNVVVFGDPRLGGGFLDEGIVSESIGNTEAKYRARAEEIFGGDPTAHARAMMIARKLKEKYFDSENGEPLSSRMHLFRPDLPAINISVNAEVINAIITHPQALLDGSSFYRQLQDQLEKACRITEKEPPKVVALTGGASRMQFFREMCEDAFQPCGAEVVFSDRPALDVSFGLALDGRYLEKLERLTYELKLYAESEKTENLIASGMPELLRMLSEGIMNHLMDDNENLYSIRQAFRDWKGKEEPQSLNDLKKMMESNIRTVSDTEAFSKLIEKIISDWLQGIFRKIQTDLDTICRQLGLSPTHVQLKNICLEEPMEINGTVLSPGARVVEMIDLIITSITAIVAAALTGGGGIALIMSGPLGWLVGVVFVGLLHVVLRDNAIEAMMNVKLPGIVRSSVSEKVIFSRESTKQMTKDIEEELKGKSGLTGQVQTSLARYIDKLIETIACQTRVG